MFHKNNQKKKSSIQNNLENKCEPSKNDILKNFPSQEEPSQHYEIDRKRKLIFNESLIRTQHEFTKDNNATNEESLEFQERFKKIYRANLFRHALNEIRKNNTQPENANNEMNIEDTQIEIEKTHFLNEKEYHAILPYFSNEKYNSNYLNEISNFEEVDWDDTKESGNNPIKNNRI